MSREIKRVPVDWDWPLNKVWEGYLTPAKLRAAACPDCCDERGGYGCGSTAARKWVEGWLHLLGMMAEDVRAQSFAGADNQFTQFGDDRARMHPYLKDLQKICIYEHRRPSPDIVELVDGLRGERKTVSFGYSSDVAYKLIKVLTEQAGLPEDWGYCPTCKGEGSVETYPGQRAEAEAYHETEHEPPEGDGWQVWETVSEGSPISPVFPEREGLILWLMSPAYCMGVSQPLTRPQAEAFVGAGHSIGSGVFVNGTHIPGDAAVYELAKDKA